MVRALNFKFEDTPEGQFVETIIAAQGQLERLQNRRQTLQKMKARLERGYCVFAAPVGFRYEKVEGHGRMLVRDEPLASIITEALEGYASGRFQLQAEVRRFLASHPEYPRDRSGEVRAQRVTDLLKRPVYAGHCGTPLTACWTKGKYSRYPYYLCPRKGCESHGKSIRRTAIVR